MEVENLFGFDMEALTLDRLASKNLKHISSLEPKYHATKHSFSLTLMEFNDTEITFEVELSEKN